MITDARANKDRLTVIVATLVILAGAIASVVVATRGGESAGSTAAARGANDPHAPRTVSKELLNAVDKITLTASDAELVARGRELFRSSAVAKDGESCQSCHTEGGANADLGTTPHTSPGAPTTSDFRGVRDPIVLYGVGETDPYFWIGNTATLNEVAVATMLNHFNPPANTGSNLTEGAAALTAYMMTIKAPTSDFDRGTMSESAQRGLELFQGKAGCVECHGGPNFTDNLIHNTKVPQGPPIPGQPASNDAGAQVPASGTCPDVPVDPLKPLECGFNTPTLRGLSLPGGAPYMHNGVCLKPPSGAPPPCNTLEQVVDFYNTQASTAPLNLTTEEKADLVAFLKEL